MSAIQVFKFGGASIISADAIKNISTIIQRYKGSTPLVVVISAMGKTTNALEKVLNLASSNKDFSDDMQALSAYHYQIIEQLFPKQASIYNEIHAILDKIENDLKSISKASYNYSYDRIVSQGEFLSTRIVSAYLQSAGIPSIYKDVRTLIRTDNTYREAKVNWEATGLLISQHIQPILNEANPPVIITQGFIGCSEEGESTTLGREGSDYSAAIIAHSLDAACVTIWKDVPGVLNADPQYFSDAQLLPHLSYQDAIELAYYGATVIHPKTMKPLQNKNIPLKVKSFLQPDANGTLVDAKEPLAVIPSFIFKTNQLLISISPKDFSFIVEENISDIFNLLAHYRVKVNLMQHSALSFQLSVDNDASKTQPLYAALSQKFIVEYRDGLELITVRNYNQATIERLMKNKTQWVEQKNSHTVRLVVSKEAN
ncbi:MAG: aspartate kinase [Flavobacteriales bacterium]|nr:aspartate kinase [Chitinophagales bacterium]MCZ2442444.1 aspartate kinase [Flavobacteriales bacterium]